jgi:hypothetical protein
LLAGQDRAIELQRSFKRGETILADAQRALRMHGRRLPELFNPCNMRSRATDDLSQGSLGRPTWEELA